MYPSIVCSLVILFFSFFFSVSVSHTFSFGARAKLFPAVSLVTMPSIQSNAVLCRRCLMAYTSIIVAITAFYLVTNWGVHSNYVAVREEMLANPNGEGDLEGVAFIESGGAEYLLVLLYFAFHVVVLALLLMGRQRNVMMGVACALLLACSMLYSLFYGCLLLQAKLEQSQSFAGPGGAPLQQQEAQQPYKLTAKDVDRTIASGSAGAEAVVEKAPPGQEREEGTCGSGVVQSGERLSYVELGWTVLETLVDVLAAIVAGPAETLGNETSAQRYHPDGMPIAPTPPFASIRRLSLVAMSLIGVGLSMWGVMTFDLSPQGVAKAANPGLTASAVSQLSSSSSASRGKAEKSDERRRERVVAALQESSTAAAREEKKNQ